MNFTLLLDAQGSVFSFGAGDHGQLGHGDLTNRDTPRVIQLLASQPIKLIAAGVPVHYLVHCMSFGRNLHNN